MEVSIIMPAFNTSEFIADSIKSVQAQTFESWELIIVDDHSTDETYSIAQSFAELDNRITLIKNNENIGGAASRNIAIEKTSSRFIAFLDSDDLWLPQKLEKQVKFMIENAIGFSFSSYQTISEDGVFLNIIDVPNKVSLKNMYSNNYIGCLTVIYDVTFFGRIYMPNIRKRQDYALWLVMLEKFDFVYSLNENLASYRIRKESLSSSKTDAIKYYWTILRQVAKLSPLKSFRYTCTYVFITATKKKFPALYSKIINSLN